MEEKLTEVAVEDFKWRESATSQLSDNRQLSSEIEDLSQDIIDSVVAGYITMKDLRAGVAWANALDYEAVTMYGADIEAGDQQLERLARRTMHQVGRTALEALKNSHRRVVAQVVHANKSKIL